VVAPSTALPVVSDTLSGVASAGDAALVATTAGNLTLASDVNAAGHNVLLQSAAGSVVETTGKVVASGLIVRAAGDIDMEQANQVVTLAARYGGGVSFNDAIGLTVGTVSVASPSISDGPLAGVGDGTGTGDVALVATTAGNLTLASDVNAAGHNVLLQSAAGSVVETTGKVVATGLIVEANTDSALNSSNVVSVLAANVAAGGFGFTNAIGFDAASVTVTSPSINDTRSGVKTAGATTTDHDIGLVALTQNIRVVSNVDATGGALGNVLLRANDAVSHGAVNETTGAVLSGGLIVDANGNSTLVTATNDVTKLAASVSAGELVYKDANSFAVDTVNVTAPAAAFAGAARITGTKTGVGASNAQLIAAGSGSVALNADVNVVTTAAGHGVLLSATGGTVTESGGKVVADGLIVQASGTSTLNSGNDVNNLAASVTAGGLAFTDAHSFTISTVTVPGLTNGGGVPAVPAVTSVGIATGGFIRLMTPANIGSVAPINAGGVFTAVAASANFAAPQTEPRFDFSGVGNLVADHVTVTGSDPSTLGIISTVTGTTVLHPATLLIADAFFLPAGHGSETVNGSPAVDVSVFLPPELGGSGFNSPTDALSPEFAASLSEEQKIEDRFLHGDTVQTPAQQSFFQYTDSDHFGDDPFRKRYNIVGVTDDNRGGFNDISYIQDGFWEGLLK
jgi:hypothetical protein